VATGLPASGTKAGLRFWAGAKASAAFRLSLYLRREGGPLVGGAPVDVPVQALRAGKDSLSFRELVADDPETDRT
jgi:hypothetical protein